MAAFLDVCRFNPTAGGTTDWTYSSAVTGYQSPTAAGVVNGRLYKYRAESSDLSQWEVGEGAYNTGTGVLARTTVLFNSSGTTSKINFSAAPQVAVVALKEDLLSVEEANSFNSTQQAQARSNILAVGTVKVQKFTASGTYTPSTGLLYAIIECVGGGGGGGGCDGGGGSTNYAAGGGGAGSRSIKYATAAAIGASQTVTIGTGGNGGAAGVNGGVAGGDTSVGSLCIGKGGSGGGGGNLAGGGLGGVAGTGDITTVGQAGMGGAIGNGGSVVYVPGGGGGSSPYGQGGRNLANGAGGASSIAGEAATGYGSGGGGGLTARTATGAAGGNGSPGLVIITEFCTQ